MKKLVLSFLSVVVFTSVCFSQIHTTKQSHQSLITAIEKSTNKSADNTFFTASEDGFLINWKADGYGEHYQVSNLWIKNIACSPNGTDVAVYETDGASINIVTVWNWKKLTKKFQKKYNDTITSLAYSAKGTYLIVGTSSIEGAEFLKTSNYSVEAKLKEQTNIVNYIWTSDTEKTVAFYSTSGNFSIFNLQTGELKTKYSIYQGLSQTTMYGSNLFTGVRDNNIYIFNVNKKKLISSLSSKSPLILSTNEDDALYYLEKESNGKYILYKNEISDTNVMAASFIVETIQLPKNASQITSAKKLNNNIILAAQDGTVYNFPLEYLQDTKEILPLSENTYKQVSDIKAGTNENEFLFLAENEIFKTNYKTGTIEKVIDTQKQKNFLLYKNNVILWTNDTMNNVIMIDLETKKKSTLFTPGYHVQNIKLCSDGTKDYLVEIETKGIVNLYDFETKKYREIYTGTGIQDAVIAGNGYLYIAKTSSTYPYTPLLKVNLNTFETAPTKFDGSIAYALTMSGDNASIYGIMFNSDENDKHTYVFNYNPVTDTSKNILMFDEEDGEAFTYVKDSFLFTNIGQSTIFRYDVKKNKKTLFKRSASIPTNVVQNGNYILILNSNGSVTWADNKKKKLITDCYLTQENNWVNIGSK